MSLYGIVINLNMFGATVRLENGELASALVADVDAHRPQYERSLSARLRLAFIRNEGARRPSVMLAPQISDERLEGQITSYLKSTEEWESADGVPSHERHFLRKKRRAAHWEAKQA
ncbi:MAG TPA: hypothetical protein VIN40_10085 [Candidatus Tyrphobacter sp.]